MVGWVEVVGWVEAVRCDDAHHATHSQQAQAVRLHLRIFKDDYMVYLQQRIELYCAVPCFKGQLLAGVGGGCAACRCFQ